MRVRTLKDSAGREGFFTNPRFFETWADFRKWLNENHDKMRELWVGYYKKKTGNGSITWPESVDEALCFSWIDGVRKTLDDSRYVIRFTPRRSRSVWSLTNARRVRQLTKLGRMMPSGLQVFAQRTEDKSGVYSYEQRKSARLPHHYEKVLRKNKQAWNYFQSKPPIQEGRKFLGGKRKEGGNEAKTTGWADPILAVAKGHTSIVLQKGQDSPGLGT
ncbi:MAG TPA: bacteriocin-protection protein [Candidatus Bathyarchaeia archaeon]|nr:bacteriocin-protection protein [Candidatus Bathyarchaeia archaeon]